MTLEEAIEKAEQAIEMGLIEREQFDAYVEHLLEKYGIINRGVGHGTAIPTDSNTNN